MAKDHVHCIRRVSAKPDTVWDVLRGFDVGWHPHVTACSVSRDQTGTLLRTFQTADGGQYVEALSYISDTDRVMCYSARSGIEGITSYRARIAVSEAEDIGAVITWHADIAAEPQRLAAIVDGTRAVFEAGLDQIAQGVVPKTGPPPEQPPTAELWPGDIPGTPHLNYLSAGPKRQTNDALVLFLHGIGGQATNWSEQLNAFGARYPVAALNLRGYGGSSLGFGPTQIDDYCSDILAVADHFGARKLVLVGLSMGSWIATSFAMRHGDRLAGLVLAGGCTGMSEADPSERESFRLSREVPLSQGQKPADFAEAVVKVIAGPNASPDVRDALTTSMAAISAATYRDALACFCTPLETFDFSRINCPVLMLTGAHDVLAPPTEIRRVSERIHDASLANNGHAVVRFEVIEDAGHVCNLERPDTFNAHLGEFLQHLPNLAQAPKASRAQKQQDKRNRILRAAHREFCAAGFDGASMNRLADAAGVSKPTLYQYFGDKEGLFDAVLETGGRTLVAPLRAEGLTLVDRLWNFSWSYAAFVLRPDMLSLARLVLGEAGRRPETAARYHQSGPERAFQGLVTFVKNAVDSGDLSVDDARLAANDLWSLILSGPRDHYLHHVNDRPSDSELLHPIGHGLRVFLKAYSLNPDADLSALEAKILSKQHALKNSHPV